MSTTWTSQKPKEAGQTIEAQAQRIEALELDNRTYINERHENMKRIEQLEAELARWKSLTERDYIQVLIQSRDFILHEFCQLQITYGEQKHRLRHLEAELARIKEEPTSGSAPSDTHGAAPRPTPNSAA